MPGLTPETPFELPDDEPVIPDKLERDAERYLPGLRKVVVQRASSGGWRKVNAFALEKPDDDGKPKHGADEIAKLVMLCVQHHFDRHGDGGGFRAQFCRYTKDGDRARPVSTFSYPLEDVRASRPNGYAVIDEPAHYAELRTLLEQHRTLVAQLVDYNNTLTDKLLQTAAAASGKTEPLINVISTLVGVYESGLKMSADALKESLQHKYSTRAAELEAENDKRFWEYLGPGIKVATKQFADGIGEHYFGGGDDDDEDDEDEDEDEDEENTIDDDDDDDDDDEGEADDADDADDKSATDSGDDEGEAEEADEADDRSAPDPKADETKAAPKRKKRSKKKAPRRKTKKKSNDKDKPDVVRTTRGWLNTLTDDQWFAFEDKLSPKQWKLLRSISRAKTDDTVARRLGKLGDLLLNDLKRGMQVRSVLRGDQWDALQHLMILAERHRKGDFDKGGNGKQKKSRQRSASAESEPSAPATDS